MFTFINSEVHRVAVAAFGAIVLTTAFVSAAVGPARAIETDASIQVAAAQADSVRA